MILIVAPYSPSTRYGMSHLGASRKLESILTALYKLDSKLVLVNSAHNDTSARELEKTISQIAGIDLIEITPRISSNRSLGKLFNIFDVSEVIDVVSNIGIPDFIWLYNGYAFEMRMALKLEKSFHVPMILEFEDWHFSRRRAFNPKPYIDYFFWRCASRLMSGVFAVNHILAKRMSSYTTKIFLLPGIVPETLSNLAEVSIPFSKTVSQVNIGFFGGLSKEKGADIVLQLAASMPSGYHLHVTGSGELSADFKDAAVSFPDRLSFYGCVDERVLYQLIGECDVMLNPHSSIEAMDNGIFPFKVIEAVASGRLLISTTVPSVDLEEVLAGVQFVNPTFDDFRLAILSSRELYSNNYEIIRKSALAASNRFGEMALINNVKAIIGA